MTATYHILLASPSESTEEKVREILMGYEVTRVEDFETAQEHFRQEHFDLLLIDYARDYENTAIELCREFKTKEEYFDCPVVYLLPEDYHNRIAVCFQMGANDVVKAPYSGSELQARVGNQLKTSEIARSLITYKEFQALSVFADQLSHDINNPLMIALMSLKDIMPHDEKEKVCLKKLNSSLDRITTVMKELRKSASQVNKPKLEF